MFNDDIAPCLYNSDKWTIRCVLDLNRFFWYVDGPFDGVDDGSLNDVWRWEEYADQHPIFFFGDYIGLPKAFENKLVFKQSCRKDSQCQAFFYHVNIDRKSKNILDCKFKVSFQGTLSSNPIRKRVLDGLKSFDNFSFQPNEMLWWKYNEEQKKELRQKYLDLLDDSQFIMCPKGVGLNSIRFFESLRMGRIPVLISDDAKLPLEHKLNYEEFCVRVPENEIENSSKFVFKFTQNNDIIRASQIAQQVSLTYFENTESFLKMSL